MSDTEPVVAFVARSSADKWDEILHTLFTTQFSYGVTVTCPTMPISSCRAQM